MGEQTVKRNFKDGVFRMLFADKKDLLELYNALSGENYTDEGIIEIVTLEDAIFGDLKNDMAFTVEDKLIVLIDHQSTICPNMPLRMFCYLAREYEKLYFSKAIYSKRLVKIPKPELYVFYNGKEEFPMEQELKLTDAFLEKCDTMELKVNVINVNYEKGAEILEKCTILQEYSRFIYLIRSIHKETGNLEEAIKEAIQICMQEGILVDFLKKNGGEVVSFLFEALTREECEAVREEDGYYRGLEEGEAKGRAEGELETNRKNAARMKARGHSIEEIAAIIDLSIEEIEKL